MPIEREVMIISDFLSRDLTSKVYTILSNKNQPIKNLKEFHKESLYLNRFANGEIDVNLPENVRNREVFVIKSAYSPKARLKGETEFKNFCYDPNTSMLELQLINDALVRASAADITNILPHMPYQRQDRRPIRYYSKERIRLRTRSAISARTMAENIQDSGAKRIITIDPHFKQIEGFYRIPLDSLPSTILFAEYIESRQQSNKEDLCIIAPDVGAAENVDILAEMINVPMGMIRKTRNLPGIISKSSDVITDVDISGRHAYILDDIVDGGGTLVNAANILRKNKVSAITACISHAVLTGNAREKIRDAGIELVTLNTIPIFDKRPDENIHVIDVSPLIAQAIYSICTDRELSSSLYDYEKYKQKKSEGFI